MGAKCTDNLAPHPALQCKAMRCRPLTMAHVSREGDKVTITDKADVHKAVGDLMEQTERKAAQGHGPRLSPPQLPPLQLELVPVSKPVRCPCLPCFQLQPCTRRARHAAADMQDVLLHFVVVLACKVSQEWGWSLLAHERRVTHAAST